MNVLLWCSTTIEGRIHYNMARRNSSSNTCQEAYRNLSPKQKSRCKYVLYLGNFTSYMTISRIERLGSRVLLECVIISNSMAFRLVRDRAVGSS